MLQHEQFMEISEFFQQTQMSSNNSKSKSSPKRSPKCNGHVGADGFHELQDEDEEDEHEIHNTGDISFIPLQERGLLIRGRNAFMLFNMDFI